MTELIDYVFLVSLVWVLLILIGMATGNAPEPSRQQPGERGITHALREGTKLTVVPIVRLFVWLFTKKPSNEEKR